MAPPDYRHGVISLPEGDGDFSTRWRLITDRFSRSESGDAHQPHIDYCYINLVKNRGFINGLQGVMVRPLRLTHPTGQVLFARVGMCFER